MCVICGTKAETQHLLEEFEYGKRCFMNILEWLRISVPKRNFSQLIMWIWNGFRLLGDRDGGKVL